MIVGIWDTENMPNLATTWGIHDQRIRYADITQHWSFICSQWKFLGKKKLYKVSILDDLKAFMDDHTNDRHVVIETCKFIETCDVLVGHNITGHDIPKLKARIAKYGLPPMKDVFIVDTYKWSKKFGFTSRKLGDLCEYLGLKHRKLTHDAGIFKKAAQGDVPSIRKTIKYGLGDLPTTEEVYLALRPYMKNHPNHNAFKTGCVCPSCGGKNFHKRGFCRHTGKQEYGCKCGRRFNEDCLKKRKRK